MSLKFRRHWKLLVLLVFLSLGLLAGLGDRRIVAYTIEGAWQQVGHLAHVSSQGVLFDGGVLADE